MYSLQDLVALTYLNIQQSASSIHLRAQPLREGGNNSHSRLIPDADPESNGLNEPRRAAFEQRKIRQRAISVSFSATLRFTFLANLMLVMILYSNIHTFEK